MVAMPPAWRITLDGCRLGFRAGRAMPVLLLTTLLACTVIEALDSWNGNPSGLGVGQDAGALAWGLGRALLKGCLAASLEIAVFRYLLLGFAEDRPVWRPPAQYAGVIVYGLAIACALALLIELLPYLHADDFSWATAAVALGFAAVAAASVRRTLALVRGIVAETAGRVPEDLTRAVAANAWRLLRMLPWQLAPGVALALAAEAVRFACPGPNAAWLANHAVPVLQSTIGPYVLAGSFCELYRLLGAPRGDVPAPAFPAALGRVGA